MLAPLSAEPRLENVYWRMLSLGDNRVTLAPEQIPHIAFHQQENRIAGFGGCNRFFAQYQQVDRRLSISIMGGGRATCPDTSELEHEFMQVLQMIERFVIDDNKLSLLRGDETLVVFRGIER